MEIEKLAHSEYLGNRDIHEITRTGINVDWGSDWLHRKKYGLYTSGGDRTWVFSGLNSFDKYSCRYHDCIGLPALAWTGAKEPVSSLCHIKPEMALQKSRYELFRKDLERYIKALLAYQNYDMGIFGGNKLQSNSYEIIKKVVSSEFEKFTGKQIITLSPPKVGSRIVGEINAYISNKQKKIILTGS